ncbi:MAG: DNA replication/repair protein RecF [Candidatus Hydrogenedentes bacterium]|nr:DNA replication/repair protein RecF [Candidatus Hydrogenedentota bacterium]
MRLLELTCDHFRCLNNLRFEPGPGLNVIRGDNAQGKTSILEAVLYAATSKSHRTSTESDLVQRGESIFRVSARVQRDAREVQTEIAWSHGAKRIKVNGVNQTRVSDLLGKINVVIFSPEDADLVRGSASNRRTFLDMELSQLHAHYLHALQRYRHAMRQRNEVLRLPNPDGALLDPWDAQLAEHGTMLMRERRRFVDQLAPLANAAYKAIADNEEMSVVYRSDTKEDVPLIEALAAARSSDIRQRMTTHGPHRDDLEIVVDDKAARQFASQGQQKTAGLAIKLAELELMRERTGEYPILLLDDVFAELDTSRSREVLTTIPPEVQCLITTTDFALTEELVARKPRVVEVTKGELTVS